MIPGNRSGIAMADAVPTAPPPITATSDVRIAVHQDAPFNPSLNPGDGSSCEIMYPIGPHQKMIKCDDPKAVPSGRTGIMENWNESIGGFSEFFIDLYDMMQQPFAQNDNQFPCNIQIIVMISRTK